MSNLCIRNNSTTNIYAKVIRKDGTIENLGLITSYKYGKPNIARRIKSWIMQLTKNR